MYNNYGIKRKHLKKSDDGDGGFQTQIPQQLDDGYKHTIGQNDRWLMRLKLIQKEYYSIGNQKS